MSDKDVMEMSEEELRLEIARLEGWELRTSFTGLYFVAPKDTPIELALYGVSLEFKPEDAWKRLKAPDWTGSRDAMAALEDGLTPEEWHRYIDALRDQLLTEEVDYYDGYVTYEGWQKLLQARPLDRARAYVATKRGKA